MKNLEVKEGYKNRHLDGLPDTEVFMKIITNGDKRVVLAKWTPAVNRPVLGTAHDFDGIGYHAWEQTNDEFTYYSVIDLV